MSNLCRYAIIGSRRFNNYYLLQNYLKEMLPPANQAIIISGHSAGTDQLAEVYAQINGYPVELYECNWEMFGKDAVIRQRAQIVESSDYCIAFWDGISPGTKAVIDMFKRKNKRVNIVDITEDDIIKMSDKVGHVNHDPFDIYIGRGKNSIFGNPFRVTSKDTKTIVLAKYTDYLLNTPELLEKVLELDGKTLGCWCHYEELCHGDVIYWLLKHEKRILNQIVNKWKYPNGMPELDEQGNVVQEEVKPKGITDLTNIFPNVKTTVDLATEAGTVFASGYERIFEDKEHNVFLEISPECIDRSMIHRYLDDINADQDDRYRVCIKYRVNDKTKTIIRYQQTDFDDELFKSNYWYVSAYKVKKIDK